jgi:hypothetical protein
MENNMENDIDEYLTTKELSARIKMTPGSIRGLVWRGELKQGTHYHKAGRRKLLFRWESILTWLKNEK